MTPLRFALHSLAYHWRMNLAVALGVMAGTAVLTGALLVGDSVRGSLRHLTFDRLGPIDQALVSDHFFRSQLATELSNEHDFQEQFSAALPAVVLPVSLSQAETGVRANHVQLLAGDSFLEQVGWPNVANAGHATSASRLQADEIDFNEPLAAALGAKPGDDVLVRLPTLSEIPRDSALGRKTETITSRRLRVRNIIPALQAGRFSLRPNQALPLNAYVDLEMLQTALGQPGRVNAIFLTNDKLSGESKVPLPSLHPKLADFGLHVVASPGDFYTLTSDRMLFDAAARQSALAAFGELTPQPVFTYLANSLAAHGREIPYSTVAAIDLVATPPLGPWTTPTGATIPPLGEHEIVLNEWAASDLQVHVGDEIQVRYFQPESTHGTPHELSHTFRLAAISAMSGPAADPGLTPTLPGVTDQLSIADWNPPFPFDSKRVRKQDEDYWKQYKATPKAFISLAQGRKLFGSRFGDTTSIRVAPVTRLNDSAAMVAFMARLWEQQPQLEASLAFQPVKAQGLAASAGTTPFNLLFLGFSMFIIAAALMLVTLLFRLGIEQRATEIGVLRSIGFSAAHVRRLLLKEGFIVAALGSVAGLAVGVGYAWLMLVGLRTWWLSAVSTPFLQLHMTATSLAIGYLCGLVASLGAIYWALRHLRHVALTRLLAGDASESSAIVPKRTRLSRIVAAITLLLAVVISLSASRLSGEAQAGAFFGAGTLVLTATLAYLWSRLRSGGPTMLITAGSAAILRLALRNAARHPGRTTLTIGLVASASFLILAISAFHVDPPTTTNRKDTGTGGYALVAESDQPIYQDLNSSDERYDLGFSSADEKTMTDSGARVDALRVEAGDDASCLNLYQPTRPRVLGVPPAFVERGGFAWAATAPLADHETNPWTLLRSNTLDTDGEIPVVLDFATAVYSLHLKGRPGDRYTSGGLTFRVVGLLQNSVFQGSLLIDEATFLNRFPTVSGYQFFVIDAPADQTIAVERSLDRALGDFGFDAQRASERLAGYLAVQNTYLETFQSLGGLGLLLGTFGLATLQLRNIVERRGELALLRAVGFRRALLGRLVLWENTALIVGGLVAGALAAAVALTPHLGATGEATIPWLSLLGTLGIVLAVGLLAGLLAVRAVLVAPVLAALRGK